MDKIIQSGGTVEDSWREIQPTEGHMLLLVVEQVDLLTWSAFATKPDAFAGRCEGDSIGAAVAELVQQIREGTYTRRGADAKSEVTPSA